VKRVHQLKLVVFKTVIVLVLSAAAAAGAFAQSSGSGGKNASLRGHWKSSEAVLEIKAGSKITINDAEYDYAVVGASIIVSNDEGEMVFPYKLAGDTLTVWVEGEKVVYTRMSADEIKELQSAKRSTRGTEGGSGGVPQDLVGKWCYQANVQAQGGGRMSNICFTLRADGTYEYYGETSSSNPYGGSASQSGDSGRWSATATTLVARSKNGQTTTYTLERRNHPRTGDAMLIVDGDAFVTFYQRDPW
jgi:hypothetical protein